MAGLRLKYGGHNPVEEVTESRPVIDSNHGQIPTAGFDGILKMFWYEEGNG